MTEHFSAEASMRLATYPEHQPSFTHGLCSGGLGFFGFFGAGVVLSSGRVVGSGVKLVKLLSSESTLDMLPMSA